MCAHQPLQRTSFICSVKIRGSNEIKIYEFTIFMNFIKFQNSLLIRYFSQTVRSHNLVKCIYSAQCIPFLFLSCSSVQVQNIPELDQNVISLQRSVDIMPREGSKTIRNHFLLNITPSVQQSSLAINGRDPADLKGT